MDRVLNPGFPKYEARLYRVLFIWNRRKDTSSAFISRTSCTQSVTFVRVETNSSAVHFAERRLKMSAARIDKALDACPVDVLNGDFSGGVLYCTLTLKVSRCEVCRKRATVPSHIILHKLIDIHSTRGKQCLIAGEF
jgi:hypothetical protein